MDATNQACYVYIIAILCLLIVSPIKSKTVVKTSQGILNGTILEGKNGRHFSGFIGIPYAEPPIGKLRFKNPVPKKSWDGIRPASEVANKCPQIFLKERVVGDEDCLYLNVFSPIVNFDSTLDKHFYNDTLLPVMVYIHGGGFFSGSSDPNFFNPKYLLSKDIIFVSMNYRLGILGFLSTGDSEAPGNFGLKDQVLSLKWIQKNIQVFGGDPNKVTIFGSSAGGSSVALHVLSKATHGLFHQYISQSGNALNPWSYRNKTDFKSYLNKLAEKAGCPLENSQIIVECLRKIKLDKLVMLKQYEHFDFPELIWAPTDEDESENAFLTDSPRNLVSRNKMKDYPSIIGSNLDEGMIVSLPFYINRTLESMIWGFDRCINLTSSFYLKSDKEKFRKLVQNFYHNDSNNVVDERKLLENYTNFVGDSGFIYPAFALAEKISKTAKSPVYFYSFAFRGSVNLIFFERNITGTFGVPHGDDILYVFAIVPQNLLTKKDEQMIELMVDLWTSFATTGKPTSDKMQNPDMWLPFSENNSFLQIGNMENNFDPSVTLEWNYLSARMNFWKANFPFE